MTGEDGKREVLAPEQPGPFRDCSSCAFHDVMQKTTPDGQPMIGEEQMICRRLPPTVVVIQAPTPQGMAVNLMPTFPPVGNGQWCYSFVPENGAQDAT